ncbi:MAG: nuclear transport factor 2 family protein [Haloarculaceae archaeon]
MSQEDVAAIQRLKHEYCYAIDGGDYEEWASLFTEDGRFVRDNGDTFEGHDELYGFASEGFDEAFDHSAHVVTNPVIDVDGDEATGNWYLLLFYENADGGAGWTQAMYDDEYRKVDGEWKVAASQVTYGVAHEV